MTQLIEDVELVDVSGGKSKKIYCYKYKVRSGDYLSAIAARFNTSVEEIMAVNQNKFNSRNMTEKDQIIYIPKK